MSQRKLEEMEMTLTVTLEPIKGSASTISNESSTEQVIKDGFGDPVTVAFIQTQEIYLKRKTEPRDPASSKPNTIIVDSIDISERSDRELKIIGTPINYKVPGDDGHVHELPSDHSVTLRGIKAFKLGTNERYEIDYIERGPQPGQLTITGRALILG